MIIYFVPVHAWVCAYLFWACAEVRGQLVGIAPLLPSYEAGNQTLITELRGKQLYLPIKLYLATVSNMLKRRIQSTKEAVWHTWLSISISPSLHLQTIAASSPDGVLGSMGCGRICALCFNSYQSVSNVFMEKYGSHLATKLFLKSRGKLPMLLQARERELSGCVSVCLFGKAFVKLPLF